MLPGFEKIRIAQFAVTVKHPLTVVLTDVLYRRMLDHALTQPHLEVCGLLGGSDGLIENYYPIENTAADPHCGFLMDPAGQIQAMRTMRERGESLAGIFHTHPNSPAYPSATDRREARYTDIYYLILSLEHPTPEIKAFYYDGNCFHDTVLTVVSS